VSAHLFIGEQFGAIWKERKERRVNVRETYHLSFDIDPLRMQDATLGRS
jgi:hypothetical protein